MVTQQFRRISGEILLGISILFLITWFFQLFRKVIFEDDARRVFVVLQCLGYGIGGRSLSFWCQFKRFTRWVNNRIWMYFGFYIIWALIWAVIALLRHWGFHTLDLDFGITAQYVQGVSLGKLFATTMAPNGTSSFLHDHQVYTMASLAWVFWLPRPQEIILVLQSFLLFLPGLMLALWTRGEHSPFAEGDEKRTYSWLILLCWCFFSTLTENVLWDFRETLISIPLLVLWGIAFVRGKVLWFFVLCLLLGLTKEHFLIVLIPSVLLFPVYHARKIRSWVIVSFVSVSVVILQILIFYAGRKYFAISQYVDQFNQFGSGLGGVIRGILTNPLLVLQSICHLEKIYFFVCIFIPLMFSPLASGWLILTWFPLLFIYLVSNREAVFWLNNQYALEVWAAIAASGVVGWKVICKKNPKIPGMLAPLCLLALFWQGPKSPYLAFQQQLPDARKCWDLRGSLREEVKNIQKKCAGEARAIGGGWVNAVHHSSFSQILDLVWVYSDRPAFDYPFRQKDAGVRRSEDFQRTFKESHCRFFIAAPVVARDLLKEMPGKYELQWKNEGCHPGGLELWLGN